VTPRARLVAACAAAAIVIAEAAILRIGIGGAGVAPFPDRLMSVLVASALLLAALLALPRSTAVAWPGATAAAAIGTIDAVSAIRSLDGVAVGDAWRDLTALAGLALVLGASIAAAYANHRGRGASRVVRGAAILVGVGLVATFVASFSAVLDASVLIDQPPAAGQLSPLRLAIRLGLLTIAGGFLVGLGSDVSPPAGRAFDRWRADPSPSPDRRLWRFAELLANELLPGRDAERRRAVDAERSRIAADLHALVLPELRRAAATAEAAGLPPDVQVDLRRALEDVEQLMHERQSIVLEQFGLVAALEWLAERTEERSRLRVDLELEGEVPDHPGAVEPAVARAAFRIALLALDNVVRHATATTATLRLAARTDALRLEVIDDGRAPTEPDTRNGRGIADMRAAAAATGGRVAVSFASGAHVQASWPRTRGSD
jgi:signal transduction histidine kinase